ncbi:hypothetical protein HG530_014960 [Fusarium avenaceum]|nr:hypothetical protein HG530_014960 [Fusarium avenaceum]
MPVEELTRPMAQSFLVIANPVADQSVVEVKSPGSLALDNIVVINGDVIAVEFANSVSPHDRVAGLVLESEHLVLESVLVYLALEGVPGLVECLSSLCTFVVGIVEVLNDCLAGVELEGVRNVMEPEHEVIGSSFRLFVSLGYFSRILACISCAIADGAVHSDVGACSSGPLAPSVVVLRSRVGTIVSIENVGQGLDTEIAGVTLIRRPGSHRHIRDSLADLVIQAKGQSSPILENRLGIRCRLPSHTAKGVEVRHGKVASQPSLVCADVGDSGVSSQATFEDLSRDNVSHRRLLAIDTKIRIEDISPKRWEIDKLLEELHSSVSTIRLPVSPVKLVVDKSTEHDDTTVRLKSFGKHVGTVSQSSVVCDRPRLSLGVGLDQISGHIGNALVETIRQVVPPLDHPLVKGIKSVKITSQTGRGKVEGKANLDTPWTKKVGDLDETVSVLLVEEAHIGVDVVNNNSINSNRSKKTTEKRHARKILLDVLDTVEKDGRATVSSFNGTMGTASVEVVPLRAVLGATNNPNVAWQGLGMAGNKFGWQGSVSEPAVQAVLCENAGGDCEE